MIKYIQIKQMDKEGLIPKERRITKLSAGVYEAAETRSVLQSSEPHAGIGELLTQCINPYKFVLHC